MAVSATPAACSGRQNTKSGCAGTTGIGRFRRAHQMQAGFCDTTQHDLSQKTTKRFHYQTAMLSTDIAHKIKEVDASKSF